MPSTRTLELYRKQEAPTQAREALADFREELSGDRYNAARLLLSELVTNAVKYGGAGPLRVELSSLEKVFRVEVIDDGSGFTAPVRDTTDLETPGGWGLHLVDALADRWGTYAGSTHVWFELHKDTGFEPVGRG
jgi:anti-sigma regulatory factor (Ser/Thr protein kinase)